MLKDLIEMEMHDKYLEILIESGELKKQFGKCESGCKTYCRYSNVVLGSSNLSDIINYCQTNSIELIKLWVLLMPNITLKYLPRKNAMLL